MNYITRNLIQHTPLLHFQGKPENGLKGISLRASEVKPKLDRFLINQILVDNEVKLNDINESKIKKYRINYVNLLKGETTANSLALDYKLRVINVDPAKTLGATGIKVITEKDKTGIENNATAIRIFTHNLELRKLIEKHIDGFFAVHNFGTRPNKGWGSYTTSITTPEKMKELVKKYAHAAFVKTDIFQFDPVNGSIIEQIRIDHQRLKSGVNHGSFKYLIASGYEKSALYQYFDTKNIAWEKRKIKEEITGGYYFNYPLYSKTGKTEPGKQNSHKGKFIRALLGLPEHYEFQIDWNGEADKRKKYKVRIDAKQNQEKSKEVKRFKSPITFKPYNNIIFIIAEVMPDEIFNAEFVFELGTKSKGFDNKDRDDNNYKEILKPSINTPSHSEFNLVEFLNQYTIPLNYKPL